MRISEAVRGRLRRRYEEIWGAVAAIPRGRVATYGDVARMVGLPGAARMVGRALRACPPGADLPWHRVIAAGGRIALPDDRGREQRRRLTAEGVPFAGRRVILPECRWDPPI
ncbi:MAG: MGMT family protein [Bryobacterales bacterium]|nr:MGMT family protein [Bryobacterales bacterium]